MASADCKARGSSHSVCVTDSQHGELRFCYFKICYVVSLFSEIALVYRISYDIPANEQVALIKFNVYRHA